MLSSVLRAKGALRILTGAVALACLGAGAARAQVNAADTEAAARGKVTYRIYCMNCHGPAPNRCHPKDEAGAQ